MKIVLGYALKRIKKIDKRNIQKIVSKWLGQI